MRLLDEAIGRGYCLCTLQVIKNWKWRRPGNEASKRHLSCLLIKKLMPSYMPCFQCCIKIQAQFVLED